MQLMAVSDIQNDQKLTETFIDQLRQIFFESAAIKEFSSPDAKEKFYHRWCGTYIEHWPDWCLLAVEDQKLLGYLVGCPDSTEALQVLTMPGFDIFSEYFSQFPAHLHMNIHHSCRGQGVGQELVERFCRTLQREALAGVFIITAAMSRPTHFYMKNGFNHSYTRDYGSSALILMGRKF